MRALAEIWFIRFVLIAVIAFAAAMVGIPLPFIDSLHWVFLALALLCGVYIQSMSGGPKLTGRLGSHILGWVIATILVLVAWWLAQKSAQEIFPVLKEQRKLWGSFEPFALLLAAIFLLIAFVLSAINKLDNGMERPGHIERSLVVNLPSKIAAAPMVLTTLLIFVGATLWTIYHSFTNSKLLPKSKFEGFDQYERLWEQNRWLVSIENLAIYGFFSLIFSLFIGFILAALLDQKIRFENTFRTILLYPFALSFIVTGLVWQWLLNPEFGIQKIVRSMGWESFNFDPLFNADFVIYGVLFAGLWQGTGMIMCLMLAGLRGIDEDIWKAARIDGIPMWKTYIRIVIPMMKPVFVTTLVIIAAGIVKVYDLVVAQTSGGPGIASEVPAKYVYDYMFQNQNLGQGFAASTMMLVTVLVVLIPWAYLEFGGKKKHG